MEAIYAAFGVSWLYEQLLYQLLMYQSLDTYDLQENQTVEEVVHMLQGCEVGTGMKLIELILKQYPRFQYNTIGNISWLDHDDDGNPDYPPNGLQVCTFRNPEANTCSVAFRGTPRGAWLDNAKMLIGDTAYCQPFTDLDGRQWSYLSPMQAEAMEYIKWLIGKYGDEWYQSGTRHYVTGHSKGGNQAQLTMILYPFYFDAGLSMNGPGMSAAMLEEIREFRGDNLDILVNWRLFALNASGDVVNQLGYSLVPAEQTYYFRESECEPVVLCNHSLNALFDQETAGLPSLTADRGAAAVFAERLFLSAMELEVKERADVFMTLMGVLQVILGRSLPVNAAGENWFRFIAGLDDGGIRAAKIMITVLFETEEGKKFLDDMGVTQHEVAVKVTSLGGKDCLPAG